MTAKTDNAPIIVIKRVKKKGHAAHHGGAWKVAYADFVTAMMAFFLLLWLLNATTDEQKRGIADYFSPNSPSRSSSGAGGILGGTTMSPDGARTSEREAISKTHAVTSVTSNQEWGQEDDGEARLSEDDAEQLLAAREAEQFTAAETALRQAIESVPELQELADHLLIDQTKEGLRIQIIDQASYSMFPLGSAVMHEMTRKLLTLVGEAIRSLPQSIAVKGHTDSTPYAGANGYGNWELSSDRANASRRALVDMGLDPQRIDSVVGLADQEPLVTSDPFSARNRRISIILLRDAASRSGP